MSQSLPVGKFKWMNEEEITNHFPLDTFNENLFNVNNNADTGYIFEVDIEYPSDLHDEHNDYPLAPE